MVYRNLHDKFVVCNLYSSWDKYVHKDGAQTTHWGFITPLSMCFLLVQENVEGVIPLQVIIFSNCSYIRCILCWIIIYCMYLLMAILTSITRHIQLSFEYLFLIKFFDIFKIGKVYCDNCQTLIGNDKFFYFENQLWSSFKIFY